MGYKLAGFDVVGCNEIDKRMMSIYIENHKPKYAYLEPIQEFKKRKDLPLELYNLDILDGSPPCSSFSMAGNREKDWGKEKKFKEGQQKQVLDTLFFDFVDLAKELQPKVVVAENVKGLLLGNAKDYLRKIYEQFDKAGYYCQHFLLNASNMGVPQRRERVFFLCLRKDLAIPFLWQKDLFTRVPKIEITFNEREVKYSEIMDSGVLENKLPKKSIYLWEHRGVNDKDMSVAYGKLFDGYAYYGCNYVYKENVLPTLTAQIECCVSPYEPRYLTNSEIIKASTFPRDYNFLNVKPYYVCGMSVPPLMMYNVAKSIYEQWLSKL
nr:MAG TPA: Cytosine specific methyltransferase [Caudoviricetes sp.]